MSGRSSVDSGKRSGVNTPIDHESDRFAREGIRNTLIDYRVTHLRKSARHAGLAAGRSKAWMRDLENREVSNSLHWKFNEVHAWSAAVGLDFLVGLENIAVLPIDLIGPLMRTAVRQSAFGGVGMMEYLRTVRLEMGVAEKVLADRLQLGRGSVWDLENSDNPKVSSLQRYARALGGVIVFDFDRIELPEVTPMPLPF
jgi:hypothetical protein